MILSFTTDSATSAKCFVMYEPNVSEKSIFVDSFRGTANIVELETTAFINELNAYTLYRLSLLCRQKRIEDYCLLQMKLLHNIFC